MHKHVVMAFPIAISLLACVGTPAPAETKMPRLGVLFPALGEPLEVLRRGLADLGYVEGKTLLIEPRAAMGDASRLPGLAEELVKLKVDAIVTVGAISVRAAQNATTTTPIIFAIVVDPVRANLVTNLQRPGGNTTGFTSFDPRQPQRRVELLKEALPGLTRIAIVSDAGVRDTNTMEASRAAEAAGLHPHAIRLQGPNPDLDRMFESIAKEGVGAILILDEPLMAVQRKRIGQMATARRLPTLFPADGADAGGLLSYGTSIFAAAARIPNYVDAVLKGKSPSDLPVVAVTEYRLIVNLSTAAQIGLTMPRDLVKRADQVIP